MNKEGRGMSVKGKKMTRRRGATERGRGSDPGMRRGSDAETKGQGERGRWWRLKSVWFNAGFFCQADEVGNRPCAQLLHDTSAMYFDSHFCDAELPCNLFV